MIIDSLIDRTHDEISSFRPYVRGSVEAISAGQDRDERDMIDSPITPSGVSRIRELGGARRQDQGTSYCRISMMALDVPPVAISGSTTNTRLTSVLMFGNLL